MSALEKINDEQKKAVQKEKRLSLDDEINILYVALTRAEHYMVPRVVKKGLLAYMLSNDAELSWLAHQYMRMFPTEI